jgi:16S rRNA (uracil1498-N3)-methyltransferase
MALPRFLVDRLDSHGSVQLGEAESHHGAKVLRLGVGDPCVVFDGDGHEALGTVESVDRKSMHVCYQARIFAPRDHAGRLHFAIAMPKGDRQRNVIEKLVELGVDRLTPLDTARSVSKFDQGALDRLERYSVEASKQSHRNRLMQIDACCSWTDWLESLSSQSSQSTWVLHPAKSQSMIPVNREQDAGKQIASEKIFSSENFTKENLGAGPLAFAIGPEGGFTGQEIAQAVERGVRVLDLGERILRVETAVSVAAVLGSHLLSK